MPATATTAYPNLSSTMQNPGLNALNQGVQQGVGSLQNAIKQQQNTTSGQMAGLQQQLQQNLGKTTQGAVNRGLGNTSVLNTLQQAPMQTYNLAAQNVQNNQAQNLAQLYSQLAQAQMGGGEDLLSGYLNALSGQANNQATNAATVGQNNSNLRAMNNPLPMQAGGSGLRQV